MKFLITLFILFSVSLISAQEQNSEISSPSNTSEKHLITNDANKEVVISVKGIKTMEDIDIEDYNKSSYLNLIADNKQKLEIC